jgi:DNA (cytosine-5)-methyltransferase 1
VKFLSLFSGIGGMDLGLERAGMACVGQVEINPFARGVLTKHWPGVWRHDDVRTFDVGMLSEQPDVIAGGFPCVDISRMGRGAGIAAPRSGLWREMVRAIRMVPAAHVLVENVVAMLERGMGTVLGDLADIGHDAEWDCLPSHAFGVRQSRTRVFVLAYAGRGVVAQPHERAVLPREVASSPVIEGQPVPNRVRIDQRPSDRVDVARRITACANAVVPQVAEWIGRQILAANRPAESQPSPRIPSAGSAGCK